MADLVARYEFDNNLNDSASNPANIVSGSGTYSYVDGVSGSAISFGTDSSYVSPGSQNKINELSSFSVTYLMRTTSSGIIVEKDISGSGSSDWFAGINTAGNAYISIGNTQIAGSSNVLDGEWHHVVVGISGSSVQVFVDGALQSSQTVSGATVTNTVDFNIGAWNYSSGNFDDGFTGSLDDLRLYDGLLSSSEVSSLYNSYSLNTGTATVGTESTDSLTGGTSEETISGAGGADYILGGGGNDLLYGNKELDTISGGSGDDVIYLGQNDGPETVHPEVNVSKQREGTEYGYGNDGNDILYGNYGSDVLKGGSGNDVLYGGQDKDTLSGGAGNDTLHGNRDDDYLVGGSGADHFIWHPFTGGNDTIGDFSTSEGDFIEVNNGFNFEIGTNSAGYVVLSSVDSDESVTLIGVSNVNTISDFISII